MQYEGVVMHTLVQRVAGAIARIFLLSISLTGLVHAQEAWPTRAVTIVVPGAPGGTADAIARAVAPKMASNLRQTFIVENRPGGGGMIAAQHVSKAAPDGYTMLISGTPQTGPQRPVPESPLGFDQIEGFTHIAYLGGVPYALVVNSAVPVKSLKELLAHAATSRTGLSWASTAVNGNAHVLGEKFREITKSNMVHIPYKGAGPAVTDLAGNNISFVIVTISSARGLIKSGALRPIALASPVRLSDFPDLQTFAEQGYPQIDGSAWFGLSGPAGMPASVVKTISTEAQRAVMSPEVKAFMAVQNIEPNPMDPAAFTKFVATEVARFAPK